MGRESVSEGMNENMFYHSRSKLIRNYTLLCNVLWFILLVPLFSQYCTLHLTNLSFVFVIL